MASYTPLTKTHKPRSRWEAVMGTDNGSSCSTKHEHEEILVESVNSTGREDIAIQVEDDISASFAKIDKDYESITLIPRVPESLRQEANGAYDPQVISIGPYHWGKPQFEAMETFKRRFLPNFLNRNPERGLRDYIKEIQSLEPLLRSCYHKDIQMTSKNFVEMMLVDGCFVVEHNLQVLKEIMLNYQTDDLGRQRKMETIRVKCPGQFRLSKVIGYDMWFLLENQLPFFFLQRIYDMATTTNENTPCPSSFIQVALECRHLMDKRDHNHLSTPITLQQQLPKIIHHLFHLRHSVFTSVYSAQQPLFEISSSESPCYTRRWACMGLCQMVKLDVFATSVKEVKFRAIPSATELHDLGIKFKVNRSPTRFHIKFHQGVMEISPLYLNHLTARGIPNIIAFERFDFKVEPFYIAFYKFIDLLINTSNDVTLLRSCGIIECQMGSDEEVALFINRLVKGILNNPLKISTEMYGKVNEYCSIKRHRWRASLIRDYCSSPWSTLGLVVGFILLALTFVQSYMSLHSYFRPHN